LSVHGSVDPQMTDFESYARARPHPYSGDQYLIPKLTELLGKRSGRYLEVGAGDGGMLRMLMQRGALQNFSDIIGSDISAVRVERLARALPSVRAEVADAMNLPQENASVDFLFSDQVIEHVPDDRKMAAEIARVLKPGGSALVGSVVKRRGAWYFYRCNGHWRLDPTHLREYRSLEEYCDVFSSAGLKVKDSFLRPLSYPIGDLAMRAMLRLKIMSEKTFLYSYEKLPALRKVVGGRLRIPRYFLCYAEVEKRA
jgi:ubiquinone/menaquinone biosynthesis C-methylase UbiE